MKMLTETGRNRKKNPRIWRKGEDSEDSFLTPKLKIMENKLSWFDRLIIPKTKAYKDFENEIRYSTPELFFKDSERKFSNQEKRFRQICKYRESKNIEGCDFSVNARIHEFFPEECLKENHVSASGLPKGWCWYDDDDGSGSLKSPNGNTYYSYDLHIKYNNQNPNIMDTKKEFDQVKYLKDQLKYLGFGEDEKLHKDLEIGNNSKKQEFEIKTTSDKTLPENKVDFILKFNKSGGGGVFLNSYNAKLTNYKSEEISHNFPIRKESSFTAKEAINLLEGRSVKIEFLNPKSQQIESAFVQFNFNEPKTEKGNYYFQNFYKNYGVDTAKISRKI